MAAYAALVSVMHIMDNLQNHPRPPITIHKAQTQSLTQKIAFLQDFLESYHFHGGNEELESLQSRIADAAHAAEDVIESHIVHQIYVARSRSTGFERLQKLREKGVDFIKKVVSVDFYQPLQKLAQKGMDLIKTEVSVDFHKRLQKVIEDLDLIEREVKVIRNEVGFKDRLLRMIVKPTVVSSRSPSKGQNIMVGFDDVLYQILDQLTDGSPDLRIIPIVGMGGIGKTTLARNVYESKLVEEHFHISSWVTISQEYNVEDVISEILKNKRNTVTLSGTREEDLGLQPTKQDLGSQLYQHLFGRKYLIILDDMWSIDVWHKLKRFFPENKCESRIIVTTRFSNLASELSGTRGHEMSFLDEESSWTLLSKTVFGEEGCPHDDLEEIGKKIAGNCKGLPLSIVVIGGLLAKHSSESSYWEYVAGNLNSFVNLEDDERCYKTLHTSYDLLPTHLKPCFLYMGIYPEDHKISVSKLIKLWVDEGFLKPINGKSLEVAAHEYLMDLIDRNLVLVRKLETSFGKVKYSCTVHDLLRDLCIKEAQKEKFLYVKTRNGLISEGVIPQRRFAIHASSSTEVHNSKKVAFQFASLARSFIFDFASQTFDFDALLPLFNFDALLPSHNSRLLRVLKVVDTCRYTYTDPRITYYLDAVFDNYVNSRHLAIHWPLSSPAIIIPSSVYYLWNLQTLMVKDRHGCFAIVPPEIWKMPLLKHVKFDSLLLPDPPGSDMDGECDDFVLWNLRTLSTVCNFKFGEGVTKRIPNIQKLKLRYEDFEEGFEVAAHYFLNNLGNLHKLESLGCFFDGNRRPSRSDLLQNLTFPHSLKKLTLEGTQLNWEDMSTTIGPLPLLEELKLYKLSFTGTRWETIEEQFRNLRFMGISLSDDLKHWITENTHFPRLEHLVLGHVLHLEEIPLCVGEISTLQSIELFNCSYGAIISAKAIQEAKEDIGDESFEVQVIALVQKHHDKEMLKGLATPNFQVELIEIPD